MLCVSISSMCDLRPLTGFKTASSTAVSLIASLAVFTRAGRPSFFRDPAATSLWSILIPEFVCSFSLLYLRLSVPPVWRSSTSVSSMEEGLSNYSVRMSVHTYVGRTMTYIAPADSTDLCSSVPLISVRW